MQFKQIATILLVLLLSAPAFAAITPIWNTPSNNSQFKNLGSNELSLDFNFGWTDTNNDTGNDYNVDFTFYRYVSGTSQRTLLSTFENDANVYDFNVNPTSAFTCKVKNAVGTSGSCSYPWKADTSITDGNYCADINFVEYRVINATGDVYSSDKNAMVCFTVNNSFAYAAATRSIASNFGLVLAAVVLLMGLFSIVVLKTDIKTTGLITIVAAIAVAIGAMVIGTMVAMI